MRVLVADDDRTGAAILARAFERWGFETIVVHDGDDAWRAVQEETQLDMAVLDWVMPGLDGPALCRRIRGATHHPHLYLILLTGRDGRSDLVAGLDAGADDYVVKPFDHEELRARVQVGVRMVTLQQGLAERVAELQTALVNIKQLTGLLPICCYCKRIRGDENYWEQVESYIAHHSDAQFSHGICPDCYKTVRHELDLESPEAHPPHES